MTSFDQHLSPEKDVNKRDITGSATITVVKVFVLFMLYESVELYN